MRPPAKPKTAHREAPQWTFNQAEQFMPHVVNEADAPPTVGTIRCRGGLIGGPCFPRVGRGRRRSLAGMAELGPGDWLGLHRHAPPETYYVIAGAGIVSLEGREIGVGEGERGVHSRHG